MSVFKSFAQENKLDKYQKENYQKALTSLAKNNISRALIQFFSAYKIKPESNTGKIALTKSDSITIIVRQKLVNDFQGVRELTKTSTNWRPQEIEKTSDVAQLLIITPHEINFYKQHSKTKKRELLRSEKIKFYGPKDLFESFTTIVYSNAQLWSYGINKTNDVLHLTHTGNATIEGRSVIVCGNSELYYKRIE